MEGVFIMKKPFYTWPFIFCYHMVKIIVLVPVKFIRWFSLGFFFTLYFLISNILTFLGSFFKYFSKGCLYVGQLSMQLFVYLSFGVYKFLKYVVFGCIYPIIILYRTVFKGLTQLHIALEKRRAYNERKNAKKKAEHARLIAEKKRKAEEEKQKRVHAAEAKKQRDAYEKAEKLKKAEAIKQEKMRVEEERKERKRKDKEAYINENVQIEKENFFRKMSESIQSFPNKFSESVKKRYNNLSFVRNLKNKRDINRQALLINFEGEDAVKSDTKSTYEYVAKNAEGKVVKGYFDAFSKVEVHSFLLSEGFEVYSIKTNRWIQMLHGSVGPNKTKIKIKDLIFLLTQLSTYIKAGIPLVESLKILTRQYKNKSYQRIFRAIIYDLTMGENFSDALDKQNVAFPKLLINMVKAAEMTGELPEALDDMADYYTETEKTRKQMITALMYPSIILVVAVAVVTFILIFVIPRFVQIYENMENAKIPAFTQFVLSLSAFLEAHLVTILIVFIILVLVMRYLYMNVKFFRTIFQWIGMRTPIMGNVIIYNEVTMFTKTFSSLLSHNVFITDSMEVLNKITNNEIYKMLILDTIANLARGEKISTAFKDHWAFPIPAYEMIVTGEKTGQLAEMMKKVSDYYQEMHKNSVTRIKTFVEPVLIIFLTVIVGGIILAVIIPMFSMYEQIM